MKRYKLLLIILLIIVGCDETVAPDTTVPSVLIAYPSNENILTEPTMVRADATDDTGIESITFLINGIEVFTDTESPYEYQWDVCVSGTGTTPTIMAKASDSAGNAGQSEVYTYTINATYDCESVCGGDKLLDNCAVCDADTTNDCIMDCADVWGGNKVEDNCGTCDADATNDCSADCAGVAGGTAELDNCGTCDNDSTNDCTADCNGDFEGTAVLDNCGVCDSDSSNDCIQDCADVWGGDSN